MARGAKQFTPCRGEIAFFHGEAGRKQGLVQHGSVGGSGKKQGEDQGKGHDNEQYRGYPKRPPSPGSDHGHEDRCVLRMPSRTPLTKRKESGDPNFFAISTASSMVTASGTSP